MCDSHSIHIGDGERFPEGAEGMKDTIVHEIGHNVYDDILEKNLSLSKKWEDLHSKSLVMYPIEGYGFVSSYAMTDKYEDFSESYMTYIRDPERLEFYSPDKYAFLQNNVFSGKEYVQS